MAEGDPDPNNTDSMETEDDSSSGQDSRGTGEDSSSRQDSLQSEPGEDPSSKQASVEMMEIGEASGPKQVNIEMGEASAPKQKDWWLDPWSPTEQATFNGIVAFNNYNYNEAVENFRKALESLAQRCKEDDPILKAARCNLRLAERAEKIDIICPPVTPKLDRAIKQGRRKKDTDFFGSYTLEFLIKELEIAPRFKKETLETADYEIAIGRLALENDNVTVAAEKYERGDDLLKEIGYFDPNFEECFKLTSYIINKTKYMVERIGDLTTVAEKDLERNFMDLHCFRAGPSPGAGFPVYVLSSDDADPSDGADPSDDADPSDNADPSDRADPSDNPGPPDN